MLCHAQGCCYVAVTVALQLSRQPNRRSALLQVTAQSIVTLLTALPDKVVPSIVLEGHKSALVEACRCVVPPGAARPMAGKINEWRGTVNVVKFHHLLHRWIVKAHYVV